MKRLFTKIKVELLEFKSRNKYLLIFNDIKTLSENGLSPLEVELFLNVDLTNYNSEFLLRYFKSYEGLLTYLNIIELCSYISYVETFKEDLILKTIKKMLYPIFLILMAFLTLYIFNHSLIKVMEDFISSELLIFVRGLYYTSFMVIGIILVSIIIFILVFKNPVTSILGYNRFLHLKFFRCIEFYYLSIFSYLLMSFYEAGYSTHESLLLINKFKDNRVISNLAYFLNSDLHEGSGIEESIDNMLVDSSFKKVLSFSMKSQNFSTLIKQYSNQLQINIEKEIDNIAKILYLISYVYIGIVVLVLYKVISLPINMLSDF